MSDNPKSPVTRSLGVAALAACALLGVVAPAAASSPAPSVVPGSQGSVPSEVARYAADPEGLLARLDDLFGVTTSGQGIEFDDTTKVGQLNRAWLFTEAWRDGGASDDPVELTNLWTAPITIADKPVGLATIWINSTTDAPDLADFDRSASSASALMDVPAEAQLVRDEPRSAWFALVEGQLTPLIAGDSGVDAATPLTAYQRTFTAAEPPPAPTVQLDGLLGAGLVAGAAVLAVLVVLLLPILRRRAGDRDPDEALSVSTAAITLPSTDDVSTVEPNEIEPVEPVETVVPVEPEPAATPKLEPSVIAPKTRPAATPKKPAAAAKAPTPKAPTPKASPNTAPQPTKPKPPASKTATARPATPKSAAAKPTTPSKAAAPKPASPRPTTAKPTTVKPTNAKPKSAPKSAPKPKSTPTEPASGPDETITP